MDDMPFTIFSYFNIKNPIHEAIPLLPIILFFYSSAFSQINLGIKGGLNIANQVLRFNLADGSGSNLKIFYAGSAIPSFHTGGFVEIPLSKNLCFMPELSYLAKGPSPGVWHSRNGYCIYTSFGKFERLFPSICLRSFWSTIYQKSKKSFSPLEYFSNL